MIKLSICINTKNRPIALQKCIQSIINNKFKSYEIIIIDQSNEINFSKNNNFLNKIKKYCEIKHLKKRHISTAKTKNIAVSKSKGQIVCFTDDDCVVDHNWLKNINKIFSNKKSVCVLFGQTVPYKKKSSVKQFCPCCFTNKQQRIITKACYHAENFGFGNNMSFRKKVLDKKKFKNWLGYGSVGMAAEDAEIALRLLVFGYQINYEPSVKVYHNKWLNRKEFAKSELNYIGGEFSCYGYYAFQNQNFAKKILQRSLKQYLINTLNLLKSLIKLKKNSLYLLINQLAKIPYILKGIIVAKYYSLTQGLNL